MPNPDGSIDTSKWRLQTLSNDPYMVNDPNSIFFGMGGLGTGSGTYGSWGIGAQGSAAPIIPFQSAPQPNWGAIPQSRAPFQSAPQPNYGAIPQARVPFVGNTTTPTPPFNMGAYRYPTMGVLSASILPARGENGTNGTGTSRRSQLEAYARDRIDGALGAGTWDTYFDRVGKTILDRYEENPNHYYWDEPKTPEGAINSFIRDEQNNARNAAQWQREHGNTPIPEEMWQRWYYANRNGLGPNDVMNDGSQVVY